MIGSDYINFKNYKCCYDNYFISVGSEANDIYVHDMVTERGLYLKGGAPAATKYHIIIVDKPQNDPNYIMIILEHYIRNVTTSPISIDIKKQVEDFCGDYYKKYLHIFNSWVQHNVPFHWSILLSTIINRYAMKQAFADFDFYHRNINEANFVNQLQSYPKLYIH